MAFFLSPIAVIMAISSIKRANRQGLNVLPSVVALLIAGFMLVTGAGFFGSFFSTILSSFG
ncbi:hypothetical protein OEB99_00035 [Actinotalea sp. M2MS4P-6]|uniref:hypothetical protein n=1 Tax=Actinotalea sp. M2MS4P-6 TaxID=2983762 RepID=UPI0021E3AD7A|nr:hypothetical protein [Actinotalea sp. M2MS4P-6]MCV2392685.1 hypothetical protein [Actinotalea sp. M2MS4P-6]